MKGLCPFLNKNRSCLMPVGPVLCLLVLSYPVLCLSYPVLCLYTPVSLSVLETEGIYIYGERDSSVVRAPDS